MRPLGVKTSVGLEVCSEVASEDLKTAIVAESIRKWGKYIVTTLELPLLGALQ